MKKSINHQKGAELLVNKKRNGVCYKNNINEK